MSIRSATVLIERRLQLNEASSLSSPYQPANPTQPLSQPDSSLPSFSPTSSYQELSSLYTGPSIMSASSSNNTITPHTIYASSLASETQPLVQSSQPYTLSTSSPTPSKIITTPIAGAESSGQFLCDEDGVWSKTLTLQWPATKSHSRWAIGETIESDLVSVKFFVRVKVVFASVAHDVH